ncbi:arsenite methyltransferase-like [Oscarella lobularis]|uniref:arsenite methyltransferase-like n=1 Tax=Oscarella lobularis TaxID=121494 RepID=UPI003313CFAD
MALQASTYRSLSVYAQEADALKFIDEVLQPQRNDRLLDLGCGTGNVTLKLAQRIGPRGFLAGVDLDVDRINIARSRFKDYKNVKIVRGSVEEAEEFSPFDVVNSNHVIHWIPFEGHKKTLRKIYDLLRPGGRFGFTTVRHLVGFLRDLAAIPFNNSYDSFIAAMGWTYAPLSYWKPLLAEVGFEVLHGVEEERVMGVFPDRKTLLDWLEATCIGIFKANKVSEKEYEQLLESYGYKTSQPVTVDIVHVDIVVRKPIS